MDVKEESILGAAIHDHWYYIAKGRALLSLLGDAPVDEVLDVGAGSGIFTRRLLDAGIAQRGICVDPAYREERTEDHNGHPIDFVRQAGEFSHQLVLMMDVLEHVDDDLALLSDYVSRMPRGGRVLITVPAFSFLWSGHDVFLEHKRRYTLPGVERLAEKAGLRVLKGRYFFGTLFPIIVCLRLKDRVLLARRNAAPRSDLKPAPPAVNRALTAIHDLERRSLFPINRVAGLTAFCLARRD